MLSPISNNAFTEQMNSVSRNQLNGVGAISVTLLIVTVWLTTRPYMGATGDSQFYTVQALNLLMPGRFAEDLYFLYGSQDQFTLFSFIYKPFIMIFGIALGNLVLTIVGQCLFLIGLLSLARSMFKDMRIALIAVVGAIILPGNLDLISVGEPILTPRIFSEALTLYAMSLMLRGRPIRSSVILLVSITIHPLMVLPGLAVCFIYEAIRRPILWLALALAFFVTLLLALFDVQPFSRLFVRFDTTWLAIVKVRDYFCFISQWGIAAWLPVINTFALAALALRFTAPNERHFLGTVFAVAVGGIAVCFIGGDLLDSVLVVDIQTWRAVWLLVAIAHLSIGPLFLRIQRQGESSFTDPVFLLALVLGLLTLSNFIPALCIATAPMAVITWLVAAWEDQNQREITMPARILVFTFCGLTLAISIIIVYLGVAGLVKTPDKLWQTMDGSILTITALGALGLYLSHSIKPNRLFKSRIPLLCISTVLVVLACLNWDQRDAWTRYVDTATVAPPELSALLPGNSPIYWEGNVTVPWFLLKRSSYFSCDQGTGALFSRGTAINYEIRYKHFEPLQTLDFGETSWCPSANMNLYKKLDRNVLSIVCEKDPGLGYLILVKPAADDQGEVWISPVNFDYKQPAYGNQNNIATNRFYIYNCATFRRPR